MNRNPRNERTAAAIYRNIVDRLAAGDRNVHIDTYRANPAVKALLVDWLTPNQAIAVGLRPVSVPNLEADLHRMARRREQERFEELRAFKELRVA
jgi:hypothetical protein